MASRGKSSGSRFISLIMPFTFDESIMDGASHLHPVWCCLNSSANS